MKILTPEMHKETLEREREKEGEGGRERGGGEGEREREGGGRERERGGGRESHLRLSKWTISHFCKRTQLQIQNKHKE